MGDKPKPDFSGYATKAGLKCSDGRTIMPDAFKHQHQATVPLVWQHGHNDPGNVLGHAILENREDGVYAYGFFNDTDQAKTAKTLVQHKDIVSLSIFANQLVEKAQNVLHGFIREVSLVLSGANPGALIDNIELQHADQGLVTLEDEAVIYTGLSLQHEDRSDSASEENSSEDEGPTVQEVYDSMTPEQKDVVHYMVGAALEQEASEDADDSENSNNDTPSNEASHSATESDSSDNTGKEGLRMTRNVFEQQNGGNATGAKHELTHDAIRGIVEDAERLGSLKEAVEGYALKHGIENIDILFPEAKNVTQTPEFDQRRTEWVSAVLNGTKHSPFSRIKSIVADITHEQARAKGYIKGNMKKEEFFGLSKRVTTPSTIYKKQKLDRDDIIDITDFDVVAWLKAEMRLMLDEELARAILVGDGREVDDEDKIRDPAGAYEGAGIRSILHDHELYATTITVNETTEKITDSITRGMQYYKGSGSPTFFTTLPALTEMLLTRDQMGRRLYRTAAELAAELGVSNIQTVEVLEEHDDVIGIIVNLRDYTIGADRGGDIAFFDDFDIDYNQYKYLIETRVSGALTKIRSAIVVKRTASTTDIRVVPEEPLFDEETGDLEIPTVTGVNYYDAENGTTLTGTVSVSPGSTITVQAEPLAGYYFPSNQDDSWTFAVPAAPAGGGGAG